MPGTKTGTSNQEDTLVDSAQGLGTCQEQKQGLGTHGLWWWVDHRGKEQVC
jgi:hypothetical protein